MATIGVGTGSYIRPYRHVSIEHFPEDSSQTFVVGDPVILSTDSNEGNRIKVSGADPTTDRGLVGIAAESATGTAGTKIPVWLFDEKSEFVIHVEDAETLDNDAISVRYGIVADGTYSIWRLDQDETSAIVFKVVKLLDAHGDVNGRYVVKPVQAEALYGAN